jgi:hypothetical protein
MNDHEALAHANRAEHELGLTRQAMADLRAAALEELVRTPPDQTRKIDRLIMTAQIMDAVRTALETIAGGSSIAKARLELSNAGIFSPR